MSAALFGSCSTFPPPGIDKATWDHAPRQYKARLHAEEAKRTREIEKGYISDGSTLRTAIREDERLRIDRPYDAK
jgi:hypothetical protein